MVSFQIMPKDLTNAKMMILPTNAMAILIMPNYKLLSKQNATIIRLAFFLTLARTTSLMILVFLLSAKTILNSSFKCLVSTPRKN
jgi:hypothetical protein